MEMNGTLPYTLGMSTTVDGKETCINVIEKDTILPTGVKHTFQAAAGMDKMLIKFLKNQSKSAKCTELSECEDVGTMCFTIPSDVEAGTDIEAVITVGLNGLLIVTLNCNGTRIEKTLDI